MAHARFLCLILGQTHAKLALQMSPRDLQRHASNPSDTPSSTTSGPAAPVALTAPTVGVEEISKLRKDVIESEINMHAQANQRLGNPVVVLVARLADLWLS